MFKSLNAVRRRFSRLSPSRALGVSVCDAAQRYCDPHRRSSYTNLGEDRLLYFYARKHPSQFYVDVGCNDPIIHSNTLLLYQEGWHGLCVDANPSFAEMFRSARPRDIVEAVCVSERAETLSFVVHEDLVSSHVLGAGVGAGPPAGTVVSVPALPLQTLFERHSVPREFGVLSVDAEGYDLIALRSFDINYYRPFVIVVEIHSLTPEATSADPIVRYLVEAGYALRSNAVLNWFFVDTRIPTDQYGAYDEEFRP